MNDAQIFLDHDTLRLIWWALLGVLLIGFAVLDGFDMGMAILLPFVSRTDTERRIALNTVGPVWEGNQVWFILGGGAVFAAWPLLYAVAFSGFYFAMLLVLFALILRPVGFDYRDKLQHKTWRAVWDKAIFISGFVPALVFGVAFGNLFEGVPFTFDEFMRLTYMGTLFDLLNPFALLTGLVSVLMLAMHGATYLLMKTEGIVAERARKAAMVVSPLLVIAIVAALFWGRHLEGYGYAEGLVTKKVGGWWQVYVRMPLAMLPLYIALFAPFAVMLFVRMRRNGLAFIASALTIACIIANAGLALFPFLLVSSTDPKASLTVWNASSSHLTLFIMLGATAVFLPLIGIYTSWAYYKMRGKITAQDIESGNGHFY